MLEDASAHRVVVTVEDGYREGGAGTAIETALKDMRADVDVTVLGVPIEYIPHADADVILSRLGLDGTGVARSTLAALGHTVAPAVGAERGSTT
jgi:1-deoxy-D-xylulose-5-phosphate synthase